MGGLFAHNDVLYIRAENTLEQIAVEGVGQNTLKQIGGWWSENTQSNCSNVYSAFLTNSLHKFIPSSFVYVCNMFIIRV